MLNRVRYSVMALVPMFGGGMVVAVAAGAFCVVSVGGGKFGCAGAPCGLFACVGDEVAGSCA